MRRRAASNATAPESLMSAQMQGAYSLVYVIIIIIIIILIVLITMIIIRLFWSTLRVPMEASHGFRLTDKRQQQDRWLLQMLITMMIISIMMIILTIIIMIVMTCMRMGADEKNSHEIPPTF